MRALTTEEKRALVVQRLREQQEARGTFELSSSQQRLWFIDRLEPGSPAYNMPLVLRLRGPLDVTALEDSLNTVVARHDVLRSRFPVAAGGPTLRISPFLEIALEAISLTDVPSMDRDCAVRARVVEELQRPFDLATGPLVRAALLRLDGDDHVLLLIIHHIVFDGGSAAILVAELAALYNARLAGRPSPLASLPMQFWQFARDQRESLRGETLQRHLRYWKQQLADAPTLELPTDYPRPAVLGSRGAVAHAIFPRSLADDIRRLSRENGVSVATTLLAAFDVLLSRYCGQDDIVVGMPASTRNSVELEQLVGFFVSSVAVRVDLAGELSFLQVLARVRNALLDALEHKDLPFEMLVQELEPERSLSRNPIYQVMYSHVVAAANGLSMAGLDVSVLEIDKDTAKFDLMLATVEQDEIRVSLEYNADLFESETIERMLGHYTRLLEAVVADPQARVSALALLDEAERRQVLEQWNATRSEYPRSSCVHELFEEQVRRAPEAVALEYEGEELSYGELNARANRVAHYLLGQGVGRETLVGLCMERGLEMVVATLGILKAGAAYVPLDPEYPAARLGFMLEDTGAAVLLTQARLRERLPHYGGRVLCVDADWGEIAREPESDPKVAMSARDLAYVIYTSGSTGTPKGTLIEHRSVVRLVKNTNYIELGPDEVFLQFAPISFDASTLELWGSLLNGARLVVCPAGLLSLEELGQLIEARGVTTLWLTAALFHQMVDTQIERLRGVRQLLAGGEALSAAHVRKMLEAIGNNRLINGYGPTENTTFTCCHVMDAHSRIGHTVPIGRPISNTRVYVLDAHMQPVPVGVYGELYIGGDGLARGYLNRAELTAEKFVADPFSAEAGARLYRTGDLVRYLPEGEIEFLGRIDDQVKLRGYRIELGEIEAALSQHGAVRQAVAMLREDVPGDKRLVAYVVAHEGAPEELLEQLRAQLRTSLPQYMLPSAFVVLEQLPLTPNGKLDRAALPAPERSSEAGYVAPRTPTEEVVAGIWAEVLNIERVGVHDNFFELGGHSLLAVSVIERMRRAGLGVDLQALFATPTIAALATAAGGESAEVAVPPNGIAADCQAITPEMLPLVELSAQQIERVVGSVPGGAANVQDIYPLAPLQEGILFHHLMASEGDPYLLHALVAFDTRARLDSYLGALEAVIDRHDILRTAVLWEGLPEPVQVVWRRAPLKVEEINLDAAAGDVAQQLAARFDPRRYRLDVRAAPLLRVFIAHDAANARWVLLQLFHHLAIDHTAAEVVSQEVQAHLLGQAERLPAPLPFRNFVAQARLGVAREEHEAFFKEMLGDVDEPTAPFGLVDVQGEGAAITEAHLAIDASLSRRLRERARALGVSAASICHLAWAQVLARVSGRDDVVFGTVLFGRMHGGEGADRALGLFINTLPLRIRVGEHSVQDSVRTTHRQLAQLLRHEHAPLALAQRCSAVAAPAPLFSALLNYRHSNAAASIPDEARKALQGIEVLSAEERSNYPLVLSVDDLGEGFALNAQVQSPVDPRRICAYMHTALAGVVEALERAPATPIRSLDVLPETERLQLTGMNPVVSRCKGACLHERFEKQAALTPYAVALAWENQTVSYAELNRRANQLAHSLRALGAAPDQLIGLRVERGIELVVGIIGILKAGAAYMPLDPAYPKERVAFMLEDSGATIVVTQKGLATDLDDVSVDRVFIDEPQSGAETNPVPISTPDSPAYVIYTSGSTGTPKGVLISHYNVMRLFEATDDWYRFDQHDVWTLFHSYAFDFSVWELWGALLYGGRLVVVPYWVSRSPEAFRELLIRERVTVLNQTPSAFRQLLQADLAEPKADLALRYVVFGGEALELQSLRPWFERYGDARPLLVNMYGITETTVHVTYRPIRWGDIEAGRGSVIGTPIPDLRVYILGQDRKPAPIGVPGELYVGGAGVARGYLNRAELTAERFVADPLSGDVALSFYRTGDMARRLENGDIEYLGRLDDQVKLRGFRIELGEIEAALRQHAAVSDAAVLVREDIPGDKRLVAYLVSTQAPADLVEPLRSQLRARLPDYMVPAHFVTLDALPLTPNGKLDRKALPAPERSGPDEARYVAPSTPTEEIVAGIWADVLRLDRVGVHDNFFELGGHSLLAMQVVSRLRQALSVEVPLTELFRDATVQAVARWVEGKRTARDEQIVHVPPIRRAAREQVLPLSFAQERLWFVDNLSPGGAAYNIPMALKLEGELDREALERALNALLLRHESLRTRFEVNEGRPRQVIDEARDLNLELVDLSAMPAAQREGEMRAHADDEARRPFDLAAGPLFRACLYRLAPDAYVLLLTMHHIVSDGWSMGVLSRELAALYAGYRKGNEVTLPPLPIQYADFALWQRDWLSGAELNRQLGYWRKQLDGLAVLKLPTERPRPVLQTYAGAVATRGLSEALSQRIHALARAEGATLFMVMLAGFAALLSRYANEEDVAVGTAIANRNHAEIEDLVGFFVNTLVMRVDLSGEPSFRDLIARVRDVALGAYAHQDLPFERLVQALQPERDLSRNPLFQVSLTVQNVPLKQLALEGLVLSPMNVGTHQTHFDLDLHVWEGASGMTLLLTYNTDLFGAAAMARLLEHYERLLEGALKMPDAPLATLRLLGEAERDQLERWSVTQPDYPREATLHELFEAQAKRTPEAPAVVCGEVTLSYAELNARANRLGHYLRARRVGRGSVVGLCVARSVHMAVGMLAVLKAGGAYVALDAGDPAERLQFMLEDASISVLVTQTGMRGRLPATQGQIVDLDTEAEPIGRASAENLGLDYNADDLAYVIYTSGSTGRPKGVMGLHRGMVNRLSWMWRAYPYASDERCCHKTTLSFVDAVAELFSPLLTGLCVVVVDETTARDARALAQLVSRERVTRLVVVPSLLRAFLALDEKTLSGLECVRVWVTSGERLEPELERAFRSCFPAATLLNLYGSSEVSADVTCFDTAERGDRRGSLIGRPIANTRAYVLDARMNPVPVGVAGELYIGGAGLARGYLGQAELTAQRFVADPFGNASGSRLYRTGDVVRYGSDGVLEYLGRVDQQLKVRGYRVEAGEVEAALASHPGVREAVVVAEGGERLLAYFVSKEGASVGAAELREHVERTLPAYMVPSVYMKLEQMPLTASGKVNRRALPAPEVLTTELPYVAPRTATEETVAAIWAEVLGLERVGIKDNFFDLGGHSLLAMQVVSRVNTQLGVELWLEAAFTAPTVEQLAARVDAAHPSASLSHGLVASLRDRLERLSPDEREALLAEARNRRRSKV